MKEGQLHDALRAWLNKHRVPFHTNIFGRKSTGGVGDPDFLICWMSRCLYIEIKVGKNKLSDAQEKRIKYLRGAGNKVVVAYSLEECIDACHNILCLKDCPRGFDADYTDEFAKMKETVAAVGTDDGHKPHLGPDEFTLNGKVYENCSACDGLGIDPVLEVTCSSCGGKCFHEVKPKSPVNGTKHQFLGKVGSTMWVLFGEGAPGTDVSMIRPATPQDMQQLPQA